MGQNTATLQYLQTMKAVYITYCSYAKPARYDVFERIGFYINNTLLCLSAPSKVTGYDDEVSESWNYLKLRPCAINDKNQRWAIKDNTIYSADSRFKVVHTKWYTAIAKDTKGFYTHRLTDSMNEWINTVAKPMNLTIKTILAWTFVDSSSWSLYYIQNNSSYAGEGALNYLYCNPENGHIAQYYNKNRSLYCMQSNQSKGEDWNWVSWQYCDYTIPRNRDSKYWEPFLFTDNEGFLKDYLGNVLTIAQYGAHWGVPYTIKPTYDSTTSAPKSDFVFSKDMDYYNRIAFGNLRDNLEYCPAPGYESSIISHRTKRTLPQQFSLTQEWIDRLYSIATTSNVEERGLIGICGVCLLHSYSMIAEMQEYAFGSPPSNRGYFFDIAFHQNPFNSFSSRFPLLAQRLQDSMQFFDLPYLQGENRLRRYRRSLYAMSLAMLPQYQWYIQNFSDDISTIRDMISNLLTYQNGSLFMYVVVRSDSSGTRQTAHAEPILRTQNGLVIIPTNATNHTREQFASLLNPLTSLDEVLYRLSFEGTRQIYSLGIYQITGIYENPLNLMITQSNCSGDGEYRRGDRRVFSSDLINQCSSRRCLLQ